MSELFGIVPAPIVIGVVLFSVALAVVALAPTAWVDKAHRAIERRQAQQNEKQ